jgi:MYXO-CTERM domain-containing protein
MCEADPCVGTMCPADPPNQVCKGGTCYNAGDFNPDGGAETHVTVGGGGCSTGGNGAGLVLVLGVLLLRRRRNSKKEIDGLRRRAKRGFGGAL